MAQSQKQCSTEAVIVFPQIIAWGAIFIVARQGGVFTQGMALNQGYTVMFFI